MIYAMAALIAVSAIQMWLVCLVVRRVAGIARLEQRVSSLTHTIALLTDTTETGFNVVVSQLQAGPGRANARVARPTRAGAARQRRVVGEASNGRSVQEIAAAEEVAESEVALRLAIACDPRWEASEDGAMRS